MFRIQGGGLLVYTGGRGSGLESSGGKHLQGAVPLDRIPLAFLGKFKNNWINNDEMVFISVTHRAATVIEGVKRVIGILAREMG